MIKAATDSKSCLCVAVLIEPAQWNSISMEFTSVFEVRSTPTHQWRAPDKDNDRDDDDGDGDDEKNTHTHCTHSVDFYSEKGGHNRHTIFVNGLT